MKYNKLSATLIALATVFSASAQNPIVRDQFSADPTARVFNDKIYVYPSHDIPSPIEELKKWFCMGDYHVFSSDNLTDWHDHGIIATQDDIPWVAKKSYTLWAPDCVYRNGQYYLYVPAAAVAGDRKNFSIGVGISKNPAGPFTFLPEPIKGINGIDPSIVTDPRDDSNYIFWANQKELYCARLKSNMVELATEPLHVEGLPKGFKEGPFAFERNGIFYLTFPWVRDKRETLAYAMSEHPMGPYKFQGLIMEQSPTNCWTNHHSIVHFKGQDYLFYHHNDYSPDFDKNRSIRADSLFFNADGTIRQVEPTFRGVGLTDAFSKIQMDRYTALSGKASIAFVEPADRFAGWKTVFCKKGDSVRYNSVDFGKRGVKTLTVRVLAKTSARLQLATAAGERIAQVNVPAAADWQSVKVPVKASQTGIHDLVLSLTRGHGVEVDWITFGTLPWEKGAFETHQYRNLLAEYGYTQEEIDAKVEKAFNDMFYGPDKVYFEVGEDMAYVSDLKNHDARTEGMSYGMMAAVQFNKKDIFDRLWRWSKHYMQHQDGPWKGYFAWSCKVDGTRNSQGPASDGELYFVTSLIFASNRWGNDTGIDYLAEAQHILDCSMSKVGMSEVAPFIDVDNHLITFTPGRNHGAWFTDPSYHLPAFYEVWARWADDGRSDFWRACAKASREYLHKAIHPETGLNPDYSHFDGSLLHRDRIIGDAFRFDSWRVSMNIALDYSWACQDQAWQNAYADRIQNFLYDQGLETFVDQYNLDGTTPERLLAAGGYRALRHSLGLVATSAAVSLASNHDISREFVDHFWNSKHEPYEDGYFDAYFDGFLRLFALMHLSGRYQIIFPAE